VADRKVSELDALVGVADDDYLPIVDVSEPLADNKNKRVTVKNLVASGLALGRKSFGILIDGGGQVITTGIKGDLVLPYTGTITKWTLVADQVGSIVIDVWKNTYANYPPTVANTITGSQKPTLASAVRNQNTSLTAWLPTVTAGDVFRYYVESTDSLITRVTLAIEMDIT
jgi:hypothetical protein